MRVNYLSIGADILDPSHHCIALRFPFIIISYCQWGISTIALLWASTGFPNIPSSLTRLIWYLFPCSHLSQVDILLRFILVKRPRDRSLGVVVLDWIENIVRWINSVRKYSGVKERTRLGKCIFDQMRDMALIEVIYREVTWTYI